MDGYGFNPYSPPFSSMRPPEPEYPDHGDGFGEYYSLGTLNEDRERTRQSRSKQRVRKHRDSKRSRSRSNSLQAKSRSKISRSRTRSKSRSRSRTTSRTRSRSRSRSRTRSRSRSRSQSAGTRPRELNYKEPGFLDAFRVLYLTPSKSGKQPSKFLATKKRQDRIQEILKSDGFGSKRWLFYPRVKNRTDSTAGPVAGIRDNVDQRVKVDAEFFRKYKKSKKIDNDAPIRKLKRWELIFYKKLGFIQAI